MKKYLIIFLFLFCVQSTEFLRTCQADSECVEYYNSSYICQQNKCKHEPMRPFTLKKVMALLIITLVSILSNASGVGGGAIFIPIYTLLFDFTIGGAIPLSKATIFAGAITNLFMAYDDRNYKNQNKLLIEYKLVAFIVPLILAGTTVGVIVMKVLPPLIIFVCLVSYLFISIKKVVTKGIELHKKENEHQENLIELQTPDQTPKIEERRKTFSELIEPDKLNMIMCVVFYFVILLSSLLRGGKGMESIIGLDNCSMTAWVIYFITLILLIMGSIRIYMIQNSMENMDVNFVASGKEKPDQLINSHLFRRLMPNSFIAGVLAGSLGIGGGLVINPILLKEGLAPSVAAGVSSVIVLFTSLSTTTQYIIVGAFDLWFAFYIIIASGIGAIIGNSVLKKLLRKYNKPSILVWILASLLIASGIVLPIIGGIKISQQKSVFSFGSPCQNNFKNKFMKFNLINSSLESLLLKESLLL